MDADTNLETYGLESIEAIKLVVALEESYGFEFNDEDLLFDKFNTIHKLSTLLDEYLGGCEEAD
ncbi:MAG: acyl carrier protein [Clostridium sp.]|nr:acyl carrier protein [Clostridium sp.]